MTINFPRPKKDGEFFRISTKSTQFNICVKMCGKPVEQC